VSADLARSITTLGAWLRSRGRLPEAEEQFRAALAVQRKFRPEESAEVSTSLSALTAVLETQGKSVEAQTLWRERLAYWRGQLAAAADDPARASEVHLRMSELLMKTGQVEEAKQSSTKALELNALSTGPARPSTQPLKE
jgi:tetratricopeptide (TPR) repeat protein